MTGLEKIIGQIKRESDAAAAKVLERAKAEAEQIMSEAKKHAEAERERIDHDAAVSTADRLARAKSAADLQRRKMILAEKQRLIGEVIGKAKKSLVGLPDAEYFGVIVKMAEKYCLAQEGQIMFSGKDLARLPENFESTLNTALRAKGASLTISSETRELDGGFVLVYGGVEENCSFTAIFDAAHESLQDKVQELLFT